MNNGKEQMKIDPKQVEELRRLLAEATPGTWLTQPNQSIIWQTEVGVIGKCERYADAALITAAVNALHGLLAERAGLLDREATVET